MDKLLFSSKGFSQKNNRIRIVAAVVLLILGLCCCGLSQMTVSSVRNGSVTSYGNVSVFSFGRSHLFNHQTQMMIMGIGLALIVFAVNSIVIITRSGNLEKNYFKIYENHIEGALYNGFGQRVFSLDYSKITSVQLIGGTGLKTLVIKAPNQRYMIPFDEDAEEAYRLICDRQRQSS